MKPLYPRLAVYLCIATLLSGCIVLGKPTDEDLLLADELRRSLNNSSYYGNRSSLEQEIDWRETKTINFIDEILRDDPTPKDLPDDVFKEKEEQIDKAIDEQIEQMRKQNNPDGEMSETFTPNWKLPPLR